MAFPNHDRAAVRGTTRRPTFAALSGTRRRAPRAAAPAPAPAAYDDESIFVCPDRDGTGFIPSSR
ncbi:MAG TPA: hypothetical protein VFE05_22730 [Longimicrobiaceae bacterium]|jgi:hypothetical protein|nr:hypothetical protein [Longimicrobiaceae bacterium]